MEKDRFKKLFPHLAREMEGGGSEVDLQEGGAKDRADQGRKWAGYDPGIIDFLRRCETKEQALEIIDYMEARGEITPENAGRLRGEIMENGLGSVGKRKEEGYYHRNR